jgi:hypothetical protein
MGSSTILDIISSTMTFGLLMLAILRINNSNSESNYAYNQNYLLQRNMVVLTAMLEDDLKHVGAGVYDDAGGVQYADVNDLRFRTMLNRGQTIPNNIEWKYESDTTGIPKGITNPRIHYLDRIVDGVTQRMNLGVTSFAITYWSIMDPDSAMTTPIVATTPPAANPCGNIGPVSVSVRLESPFKATYLNPTDSVQYYMLWRQIRSISRNNSIQFPQ